MKSSENNLDKMKERSSLNDVEKWKKKRREEKKWEEKVKEWKDFISSSKILNTSRIIK